MEQRSSITTALGVETFIRGVGDITSLIFNPHDNCFYGCEATSKSIVRIKDKECSQFLTFENTKQVPRGIDYYTDGGYFIIVVDGPTPSIFKKLMNEKPRKIADHIEGRDFMEHPVGVTINQKTGDAYISSRNDSVHKLASNNRLMVIKERSSTVTKKGLQGILYDHDRDQLLICDMGSSRIIELDPTTGSTKVLCDIPNPFQITKCEREEYLVTSLDSFTIFIIYKAGEGYTAQPFAGEETRGMVDGIPSQSRFECPKGIASDMKSCLVSDNDCLRMIATGALRSIRPQRKGTGLRLPMYFPTDRYPSSPKASSIPSSSSSSSSAPPSPSFSPPILSSKILSSSLNLIAATSQPGGMPIVFLKDLSKLEKIGEGAQGVVYKTQWMGQEVVYKKNKPIIKIVGEEKASFEKEFQAWKRATHQSCVSLYGIVDEGDDFGFVAEYCSNGSLDNKFQENMVLSVMQVIEYAVCLASALDFLHSKKIAHRDIKSGNIMLDSNMKPKLGDFGTSKVIRTILASSTQVGSFLYMAPEIINAEQEGSPLPADVYSFGILMHELATITSRNMIPATSKPEGFSKGAREMWWNLVRDCTQPNPSNRPVISVVVARLYLIQHHIEDFKCLEHGKLIHQIFISCCDDDMDIFYQYKILYEEIQKIARNNNSSKCLPSDRQKAFFHALHNCMLVVPIVSAASLENIKTADTIANTTLKEYEHALNLRGSNQVVIFPWLVGPIPNVSEFPDSPHIASELSIRSTLSEVLNHGITSEKIEASMVAVEILDKIKQLGDKLADFPIFLEGRDKPDHTVQVSIEFSLDELRKAMKDQCDIDFKYNFVNFGTGSPLSQKQEKDRKVDSIIEKGRNRITIRRT